MSDLDQAFGSAPEPSTAKVEPNTDTPPAEVVPDSPYSDFERRDEAAIVADLAGGFTAQQFVYKKPQGGASLKREDAQALADRYDVPVQDVFKNANGFVFGPSWPGIKWLWNHFRGIDVSIVRCDEDVQDDRAGIVVRVRAVDTVTGNATEVEKFVSHRAKRSKNSGGGEYKREFAREIAQSMAKRNAIAELLPQWLLWRLVELAMCGISEITPELLGLTADGTRPEAPPEGAERPILPQVEPEPEPAQAPQDAPGAAEGTEKADVQAQRQARLERLLEVDKKSAEDKRSIMRLACGVMAEGNRAGAMQLMSRITGYTRDDGEQVLGVTDPEKLDGRRKAGGKGSALDVGYGKVKAAYRRWTMNGDPLAVPGKAKHMPTEEEPTGETEEPEGAIEEPAAPKKSTLEISEAKFRQRCEFSNVSVEAAQAAIMARAAADKWTPSLFDVGLDLWSPAIEKSARRRMLTPEDRKRSQETASDELALILSDAMLARGISLPEHKGALDVIRKFTGVETITPAYHALGIRLADELFGKVETE